MREKRVPIKKGAGVESGAGLTVEKQAGPTAGSGAGPTAEEEVRAVSQGTFAWGTDPKDF